MNTQRALSYSVLVFGFLLVLISIGIPYLRGHVQPRISLHENLVQKESSILGFSSLTDSRIIVTKDALVPFDRNQTLDIYAEHQGAFQLVSAASDGAAGNAASTHAALSGNGDWVVFRSSARNFVDSPVSHPQLFLKHLPTGKIELISSEVEGFPTEQFDISFDGRFIVYAAELVSDEGRVSRQILRKDRNSGQLEYVSQNSHGELGDAMSYSPAISDDGNIVAFVSTSKNLVNEKLDWHSAVLVRDMTSQQIECLSRDYLGNDLNEAWAQGRYLSGNGDWIVFETPDNDVVIQDKNDLRDIYLVNRLTHELKAVTLKNGERSVSGDAKRAVISRDGSTVAFLASDSTFAPEFFFFRKFQERVLGLPIEPSALFALSQSMPYLSDDGSHLMLAGPKGFNLSAEWKSLGGWKDLLKWM